MTNYKGSCFDNCKITKCWMHGHDEHIVPNFCLADPVSDRYQKRKRVKKPCGTCEHAQTKDRCWRCIHGET